MGFSVTAFVLLLSFVIIKHEVEVSVDGQGSRIAKKIEKMT